jgi:hypothetical protein
MPFSFVFNGSFFDMESFLRDVNRLVRVNGDRVNVRGRLLSIDAFSLTAGPKGFPSVTANMSATAYLQSPEDSDTTPSNTTAQTPATSGSTAGSSGASASEVAR